MGLVRPAATLTIDGRRLTLPEAAGVTVDVELSVGGGHDRATVLLGPLSPWLDVAPGATAEVAMGHGDEIEPVLTGSIERVRHLPWGTAVDVLTSTAALERVRIGRAYSGQSVGDIVRDLLAAGGVSAGDVDAGPTLGAYHVDDRRSCWRHVVALATMFGAELATGAGGEVHVREPRAGRADAVLRAGAELLAWSAGAGQLAAAAAEVGPFGAVSEQGADAWSLIHHQPGGDGAHRIVPAIRDREAASAISKSFAAARERAAGGGRVVATGVAAVRAGGLVELDGVDRGGGTYRVRRAQHRIDDGGYRSAFDVERAA